MPGEDGFAAYFLKPADLDQLVLHLTRRPALFTALVRR